MVKHVRLSAATTDKPINECSALIADEDLWSDVRDMFERAELTAALPREDSRVVVGALMALLTYRNWQRPGVCQGATRRLGSTRHLPGGYPLYRTLDCSIEDKWQELCSAIKAGDVQTIKDLVDQGVTGSGDRQAVG